MLLLRYFRFVKCTYALLIGFCVAVILPFLFFFEINSSNHLNADFLYQIPSVKFSPSYLKENFDSCLFHPNVLHQNVPVTEIDYGFNFTNYDELLSEKDKFHWFPMFDVLWKFTSLMKKSFSIQTVLLEPSVLFCMLSANQVEILLRRNFSIASYFKSKPILTLGIISDDIAKLEKDHVRAEIRSAGFEIEFAKSSQPMWMLTENLKSPDNYFTSHIFFKKTDWIIHLVVLHLRSTFFWLRGLTSSRKFPSVKDLLFVREDSAFERFEFTSLSFRGKNLGNIYIPSSPQYFLFEIKTSRFLECNSTINTLFNKSTSPTQSSSSESLQQFNYKTFVAIHELKIRLNPSLITFWIWSGTMLGWYRQCNVIPYTSDVDFAAWATEVDDLMALLRIITDGDHLVLKERMGLVEEALEFNMNCHGLRVDLFFLYPEGNGTWYAGHRPSKGYYFKYHHPNFHLCSTELFDHKVLVPCETENVIKTEYGPDWMTPVKTWDYESSIYNRGPNIYWNKSLLSEIYKIPV